MGGRDLVVNEISFTNIWGLWPDRCWNKNVSVWNVHLLGGGLASPPLTCFRRQFLRKMCPIQLAFRFLISCRMFLCSFYVRKMLTAWKWSNKIKKMGSHLWYNGMCLDSYRCLLKLCKGSLAAWTWMMYTDAEIDWYSSNRLHACYLICHVIVSFCCRRMYCIALLQGKLYLFLGEQ